MVAGIRNELLQPLQNLRALEPAGVVTNQDPREAGQKDRGGALASP